MNYRTTCPRCASAFRIDEAQLAAAAGWAQCGVCGVAFDARANLSREDGSPLPDTSEAQPMPPDTAPAASGLAREVDVTAGEAAPAQTVAEAHTPDHAPQGIEQGDPTHDLDSIILIDPDATPADDPGPLPQIPAAGARYPAPAPATPSARTSPTVTRPTVESRDTAAPPSAEHARPPASAPRRATAGKARRRWVWAAASVVLFAALLAQGVFFLRDTMVSRLPQTRPAFERVCAALGCTLALPRKLALLQIVGSDLQTEPNGNLKLALTLGNRANHVQAWPVLVLTLTDQRDRPLTRRSFAPSEYLGDAARIAAGIAPRSEEALSLPLSVRGPAPMGFDLRLTY